MRSWCKRNGIEREGRRYLITQDVFVRVCSYYSVDPSKVAAIVETKKKEQEGIPQVEQPRKESTESELLRLQMQATIDAKQEQIDLLKESLEQARLDKEKELERLTSMYTALSEKYDTLQEEHSHMLQMLVAERFRRLALPSTQDVEQVPQEITYQEPKKEKKSFWKRLFS